MIKLPQVFERMTLTGCILFLMGLLTMTPEIYFPGIIVMILSTSIQIKDLEQKRVVEHVQEENFYSSW